MFIRVRSIGGYGGNACQHAVNILAVALADTPVRFRQRIRGMTPSGHSEAYRGLQDSPSFWYNSHRQTEKRVRNAIGSATASVLSTAFAPTEKG